jgi:hypothetical protein
MTSVDGAVMVTAAQEIPAAPAAMLAAMRMLRVRSFMGGLLGGMQPITITLSSPDGDGAAGSARCARARLCYAFRFQEATMTRMGRVLSLAILATTLSCDVPPEGEEAETVAQESALPPCAPRFHFRAVGFRARLLDPVNPPDDPPPSTLRSAAAGTCRLVLREPTLAR